MKLLQAMILPALLISLLWGCTAAGVGEQIATNGGIMEQRLNTGESNATTSDTLTKEDAQAIALKHAGFTAEQVTGLRTEYEIDDGIARFEVQFRQGRWEYDYEINATTGQILSYDRDD